MKQKKKTWKNKRCYFKIRDRLWIDTRPAKVKENSVRREADFGSTELKIVFPMFTRKEAVFGKTNYNPFYFLLGPTYEQNMSEIDFLTCATKN